MHPLYENYTPQFESSFKTFNSPTHVMGDMPYNHENGLTSLCNSYLVFRSLFLQSKDLIS
jgi:hypothetical protein